MQDFAAAAAEADRFLGSIDRAAVNAENPKQGRVLVAVPVRDVSGTIDRLFERILALRYPHGDLSVVFLEGDSLDDSRNGSRRLRDAMPTSFGGSTSSSATMAS